METEIPALLRARQLVNPEETFTFHSSRMRMKKVTKEELAAMDAESDRCALELSDARVDVMGYACLVAVMATGPSYHLESQRRLSKIAADNGSNAKVITSAGALVNALGVIGAKKVIMVCPYMEPLAELVKGYIANEGYEVTQHCALHIADNLEVGLHDPEKLPGIVAGMSYQDIDAIILSACVQLPSLPAVAQVEAMTGKPVVTSSIATTYALLKELGLATYIPGGGALLSGAY
ncbi:MAG: Asp/Glu racemase [Propionibacteriaceae bacterium]|nr:Asp/Glu racemase [Propionibacteriaceae bacterium]